MANVVRLVNGGAIQVRTGVLQGIGPQGPRGVAGVQGSQGEQGPIGETGEMGQILQQQDKVAVNSNNVLVAATDTVISFGSGVYSSMGYLMPSVGCTLGSPGDYLLSVWLRFDDAAAGGRDVWFAQGSTIVARTSRQSVAGAAFYVDLAFPFRAAGGEAINVIARSSTATGISDGAWILTRIGSGPVGPIGPQGPTGPPGPTGGVGPAGPAGTANSGFTKYGDLLPH